MNLEMLFRYGKAFFFLEHAGELRIILLKGEGVVHRPEHTQPLITSGI